MTRCTTLLLSLVLGCSSSTEIVRPMAPKDAARGGSRMQPVALVRGDERTPIPPEASLTDQDITWKNDGMYTHVLADGDVVVTDKGGAIVAVRAAGGREIRFAPGTASSEAHSDEITGRLVGDTTRLKLSPGDRIEMRGEFADGDSLPDGSKVAVGRPTGLLVGGAVLLTLSYVPAAYVAATSPRGSDGALWVPIAGPWIALATRPSCTPPPEAAVLPVDPCVEETASRAALITGGVAQGVGAVLLAIGLPQRTELIEPRGRVGVRPFFTGSAGAEIVGQW